MSAVRRCSDCSSESNRWVAAWSSELNLSLSARASAHAFSEVASDARSDLISACSDAMRFWCSSNRPACMPRSLWSLDCVCIHNSDSAAWSFAMRSRSALTLRSSSLIRARERASSASAPPCARSRVSCELSSSMVRACSSQRPLRALMSPSRACMSASTDCIRASTSALTDSALACHSATERSDASRAARVWFISACTDMTSLCNSSALASAASLLAPASFSLACRAPSASLCAASSCCICSSSSMMRSRRVLRADSPRSDSALSAPSRREVIAAASCFQRSVSA
mmetsp:Transcript_7662/g.17687  ORF Transcript_7662/g.17687 Transcript_7662/m.17687 type:complete len:286 (+) Transcript_7662:341-1198(+)